MTNRKWTAEDVSDDACEAFVGAVGDCMASGNWDDVQWHRAIVASVCNIMGVTKQAAAEYKPDPATEAESLAAFAAGDYLTTEQYLREIAAAKPAPSEWPADAPDWAGVLIAGDNGYLWFAGVEAMNCAWVQRTRDYKGPRPTSWAGKPWRECILRRPTVAAPAIDVERLAAAIDSDLRSSTLDQSSTKIIADVLRRELKGWA